VNTFRFGDSAAILDDRSPHFLMIVSCLGGCAHTRFACRRATPDQSILGKPSLPQGTECILRFDTTIFPEFVAISTIEGCFAASGDRPSYQG
jgi:hypothetical protein